MSYVMRRHGAKATRRLRAQAACIALSATGCGPAPTLELLGVVEPTPACTTTAESPLVESGLLDLASATSDYVGLLLAQVNDPPTDDVMELDSTIVRLSLPDELADEVEQDTLRGGATPDDNQLNPRGISPGVLLGRDDVQQLSAAVVRAGLLDDAGARLSLHLGIRVESVGQAAHPFSASKSARLLSNEVPFTLDLCMGCVPVLCEPGVTPCFAALTQPACLREAL